MIFDQDHLERQQALDQAFAAGERRGYQAGREDSDEDLMAECIELRVKMRQRCADHYREGVEVGLFIAYLIVACLVAWGAVWWWLA